MQWILDVFEWAQQGLFELAVQPILFSFGLGNFLEDGYTATGWLLRPVCVRSCPGARARRSGPFR